MKNFLKFSLFIVVFALIWKTVFSYLWLEPNGIKGFYDEDKNSIDVVFIGASNVYTNFNPMLAYDEYGIKVYDLASAQQPFAAVKYLIEESQKYQDPKVYVIDISSLKDDVDFPNEGDIRKVSDNMKFSVNRINTINSILKYKDLSKDEYPNYYLSFVTYHNKWKNFKVDTLESEGLYQGHYLVEPSTMVYQKGIIVWNDEIKDMPQENEEILTDLIDYIKENDLNVLFIIPARFVSQEAMGRFNVGINIIESNGLEVINFNNPFPGYDVDFEKDYFDDNHLNMYGAIKYTRFFSEYLIDKYSLETKEPTDQRWLDEYEVYKKQIYNYTGLTYDEILENY